MPELSVVIASFNTRDLLARCIEEFRRAAANIDHEIIIVDNGSTDGSREYLQGLGDAIKLELNDENLGFAAANNIGMKLATAPLLLLLNSDAFVTGETLGCVIQKMKYNPRIGMAGVQILNPDGTIQAESGDFPTFWQDVRVSIGLDQLGAGQRRAPSASWPVDWVHGACMFVRREAFEQVGGMDQRFFMYSEEVDWCRRFWEHDWQVWYVPEATATHLGGGSSRSNDLNRRIALYQSRLGLRRRIAGPHSSFLLWTAMIAGLAARLIARPALQLIARHRVGRQSAGADWQLLRAIAHMDPLARYIAS